ncbi:TetR family transcriptional regulator [Nonomuraea sp. NPDC050536]|uniref:TetR/AcrR family transcriptional regulator n=1 Tax=Nonomuraea sp. NPDC050536 TaxID=3364366 RepID=UPI0037CA14BD
MTEERGRRPGNPQTRDAIMEAAVGSFTAKGYAQTTIRGVARTAGVDPALVMHFFGSKDGLFASAIRQSMPIEGLAASFDGDLGDLGLRLATRYLSLWDDPERGARMAAILHAAAATPAAADLLKELMRQELVRPLATLLEPEHAESRALLAATQLIGVAMLRYVLRMEPLTSMPTDQLAATIAPTLQRYLTGADSFATTGEGR